MFIEFSKKTFISLCYYFNLENGGAIFRGSLYHSHFFHRLRPIKEGIEDFLLVNQYIFATKNVSFNVRNFECIIIYIWDQAEKQIIDNRTLSLY